MKSAPLFPLCPLSLYHQDHSDFLVLDRCDDSQRREALNLTRRCVGSGSSLQAFQYPEILKEATFCVVLRGARLGQSMLTGNTYYGIKMCLVMYKKCRLIYSIMHRFTYWLIKMARYNSNQTLCLPFFQDAMAAGCIPVIVIDHYVLPFEDVIDWQKAAVRLYEG